MKNKYSHKIAYGIFIFWIVFTGIAFWKMQYRNFNLFIKNDKFNEASLVSLLEKDYSRISSNSGNKSGIAVYNFLNPDCICSRYAGAHIQKIVKKYAHYNLTYIYVPLKNPGTMQPHDSFVSDNELKEIWETIPSTPAVAIIDKSGKLAYFGPYSADYYCGSESEGYVEKTIDNLLKNGKLKNLNLADFGCFCPNT